MRERLWAAAARRHPEFMILSRRLLILRAILFPLQALHSYMHRMDGYQIQSDTWLISGVRYSRKTLQCLSNAQGETYKINRSGDTVTLERLTP
jgi:hypothetical protein